MRLWSKWYRKIRKNKSKPNVENNLPCIKLEEKTNSENIRGEVMRKTDIERTYFTSLIWSILFLQNVHWVSTERQHIAAAKHEWEFNFRWIPREDCLCCSTRLKTKVIKVHYQSNSTFYVHILGALCQRRQCRRHCLLGNFRSCISQKMFVFSFHNCVGV